MKEFETKRVELSKYFDKSADQHLRSYFGHVKEGNDVDYRTPLFDGKPREEILNAWQKVLEPKLASMAELLDFENDLRAKVGPLSIMKPLDERIDDIESYYESIHLTQKPLSPEAKSSLYKEWKSKIGGLRLRDANTTWVQMKKSTSSGNPYFTKRRTVYEKHGLGVLTNDGTMRFDGYEYYPTAILGWRGQEGGLEDDDVKQRVIWMFPMTVNVQELRFYQPLIEAAQRTNLVPAWNGNDAVDEQMTLLFDTKGKDDNVIATDFTKMDQHFNPACQESVLDIISELTTSSTEMDWWLKHVYPVKYSIPMMYDVGRIYTGKHGMGSGSGGTNADETLFHRGLQHEAAINNHVELNPYSMCLGDDGCVSYPGAEVDNLLPHYTSHGHEMNESKQMESKRETVYLRRWYGTDYRIEGKMHGVYSTYRALGKLMGQERFYDPNEWGPEMIVMRSLSIIENVRWHPAKDEFLEFCVKGDKYRLGLDIPGFFDNLERRFKASELAQSFVSYSEGGVRGINSWWVVNALKAMR